jgi:preprotein translocase subunit SecE
MENKKTATGDFIEKNESVKQQKEVKKVKKNKKPNIFRRLGAKLKEIFSELKRVSWPTFPKVVKQTGVVLVVVLIFLVVISAFDFGLLQLLKLVSPGAAGV